MANVCIVTVDVLLSSFSKSSDIKDGHPSSISSVVESERLQQQQQQQQQDSEKTPSDKHDQCPRPKTAKFGRFQMCERDYNALHKFYEDAKL